MDNEEIIRGISVGRGARRRYLGDISAISPQALGVWLLGPPGWRRLDIILPENRWTLAADDDDVLHTWVKLLENVAPEKPVMKRRDIAEMCRRDP